MFPKWLETEFKICLNWPNHNERINKGPGKGTKKGNGDTWRIKAACNKGLGGTSEFNEGLDFWMGDTDS